jgi:hypothetical protein
MNVRQVDLGSFMPRKVDLGGYAGSRVSMAAAAVGAAPKKACCDGCANGTGCAGSGKSPVSAALAAFGAPTSPRPTVVSQHSAAKRFQTVTPGLATLVRVPSAKPVPQPNAPDCMPCYANDDNGAAHNYCSDPAYHCSNGCCEPRPDRQPMPLDTAHLGTLLQYKNRDDGIAMHTDRSASPAPRPPKRFETVITARKPTSDTTTDTIDIHRETPDASRQNYPDGRGGGSGRRPGRAFSGCQPREALHRELESSGPPQVRTVSTGYRRYSWCEAQADDDLRVLLADLAYCEWLWLKVIFQQTFQIDTYRVLVQYIGPDGPCDSQEHFETETRILTSRIVGGGARCESKFNPGENPDHGNTMETYPS